MKALLLRAVVLARRRTSLAESTRRTYQQRLDRELDKIMALAPTNQHGKRLRKRYGKVRSHLFTFLAHPDAPPDNNGSERELRPTATYRKVTGGFRSNWGADLFANVRSVVGTAARHGIDAYGPYRRSYAACPCYSRVEQIPQRPHMSDEPTRCRQHTAPVQSGSQRSLLRLTGCPIPKRISPPRSVADWQITTRPPLFRAARNPTFPIYPYWLQSGVPRNCGRGQGLRTERKYFKGGSALGRTEPPDPAASYDWRGSRSAIGRVGVNSPKTESSVPRPGVPVANTFQMMLSVCVQQSDRCCSETKNYGPSLAHDRRTRYRGPTGGTMLRGTNA